MTIAISEFRKMMAIFKLTPGGGGGFPALVGGDGITYTQVSGTIAVDASSTNFKFDTGVLNTIQNIGIAAKPTFDGLTLTGAATITLPGTDPFKIFSTTAGSVDASMTQAQFEAILNPDNGLHAWAADQDRPIYNSGTSGVPKYELGAYLSDITSIIADGALGVCYFNGNTTPTTMVDTVTPVKVAGTYVAGSLNNISHSNGVFTNDSSVTLTLIITASMGISLNLNSGNIQGSIYVNGTTQQANTIKNIDLDGVSPSFKEFDVTGSVTLNPGDTAEVRILNTTAVQDPIAGSINFKIFTIGSAADSLVTWQDAYDNGDGIVIQSSNGKPVKVQSTDNAIIPTFALEQSQIPASSQKIGEIPFLSKDDNNDTVQYGALSTTTMDTGIGTQTSRVELRGFTNGANKLFLRYAGDDTSEAGGVLLLNSACSLGSRNLKGVANLTVNFSATFNDSQLNAGFMRVKTASDISAFVIDLGTEEIKSRIPLDMNNNVITSISNINSDTAGIAISSSFNMVGPSIIYQTLSRIDNVVTVSLQYNFTASGGTQQFIIFDVPYMAGTFSSLQGASGTFSTSNITGGGVPIASQNALLSPIGTKTVQLNTLTPDSTSLYKVWAMFTYVIE